ncbi:MAG: nucleotidyltransferase family protein [Planctomycetia bacterium]|nr:nucleotidyltransferase family protein [Planctomycetia bacterium]
MTRRGRRHALFAWAHPAGSLDQLLQAAALADEGGARIAWRQWAQRQDLDNVRFNEMRLLAAVAPRLETLGQAHPARDRIAGIERMLWSRSQIVLRDVRPALESLHQARIGMLLIKGAARIARNPAAIKTRVLNDVDVLVRPDQFRRAFDILDAAGWRSTGTGSAKFQRARLGHVHGVNLIRGSLADVDLHRSALHPPHASLEEDAGIWTRSDGGLLAGFPVRVPSATDTVIVALAHAALDGHTTSDWVLDVVDAIDSGLVDWELTQQIVKRRQLDVAAAVALTYLAERLQRPVPVEVLDGIARRAKRRPIRLLSGLLSAHPKDTLSRPLKLARGLAKLARLHGGSAKPVGVTRWAWRRGNTHGNFEAPVFRARITPSDRRPDGTWRGFVEATVSLAVPATARRIEFELNTDKRHLARVRHRKLIARAGTVTLRFRVPVELASDDTDLILEAVPGRGLRANASPTLADRYRELPFSLVNLTCRRRAA